jgi:hypothetical protein
MIKLYIYTLVRWGKPGSYKVRTASILVKKEMRKLGFYTILIWEN